MIIIKSINLILLISFHSFTIFKKKFCIYFEALNFIQHIPIALILIFFIVQ